MLQGIVVVVQVVSALVLIALVLLQQGKGADASASFGGASQTVFGSSGSGGFLARLTAICAAIFFVASLSLAYLAKEGVQSSVSFDKALLEAEAVAVKEKKAMLDAELPTVNEAGDQPVIEPRSGQAPALPAAVDSAEKNGVEAGSALVLPEKSSLIDGDAQEQKQESVQEKENNKQ